MDVKNLCLGALTLGDASGYEIRKLFEEGPFAHFYSASYGSIYPALGKLLEEGLVSVTETAQQGRPAKKVYSLTEAGRAQFRRALAEPPGGDVIRSGVVLRMFFAELLEPQQLEALYDGYLEHFRAYVEHMKSLDPAGVSEGRLFVRGLGLTFYETIAAYLEENREKLLGRVEPESDAGGDKGRAAE